MSSIVTKEYFIDGQAVDKVEESKGIIVFRSKDMDYIWITDKKGEVVTSLYGECGQNMPSIYVSGE